MSLKLIQQNTAKFDLTLLLCLFILPALQRICTHILDTEFHFALSCYYKSENMYTQIVSAPAIDNEFSSSQLKIS